MYIIEKLWTDSMENSISAALGYSIVGYVNTEEEAKKVVEEGGIVKKECWAMNGDMPLLKYKKIEKYESIIIS